MCIRDSFGGEPEHPAAHGGQVHGEGVVPAIDAAVRGMKGFGLRFVRAAPAGGLGVQQLFGPGGEAQVERELFVGSVLGVHDAEDGLTCALAQDVYKRQIWGILDSSAQV